MYDRTYSNIKQSLRRLQLVISAVIILSVSLLYGLWPSMIMPEVFGFSVTDLELKNILRSVMGLYWAMAGFWLYGAVKARYWRTATILNVLFMGGLVMGRLLSTLLDGVSPQFMIGLFLESALFAWGLFNLGTNGMRKEVYYSF